MDSSARKFLAKGPTGFQQALTRHEGNHNFDTWPLTATRQKKAAALAAKGVYVGTSFWKYMSYAGLGIIRCSAKYEGWLNQLYTPARYEYRGKVAKTRFERDCLNEYAEVFKTVSVDAAYYTLSSPAYLQKLADAVPDDFRFGFKETDAVTIKKFPSLAWFGGGHHDE